MLNHDNPAHVAASERLKAEQIIWLTTVNGAGQPQSTPVWFLWDGTGFLIYGSKNGPKTRNIQANPHVGLHLEGNGAGGANVIFQGETRVHAQRPPTGQGADYVAKNGQPIGSHRLTPAEPAGRRPP